MKKQTDITWALIACLGLIILLPLGLLGFVNSLLFKLIFAGHLLLLATASALAVSRIISELSVADKLSKALALTAFVLCISFCVSNIILPITSRDALIHHLAIPKLWNQNGVISQLSWHDWSYYPMLIQLGFTALLQILPEEFCSAYIFLFLPLFLSSLISLSNQLSKSTNNVPLVLIIGAILPIVIKLASAPLVDLPLAFFCNAALIFLFQMQATKSTRAIILAGIAFGLALSSKLNAIPFLAFCISAFLALEWDLKQGIKERAISLFKVCFVALIVFSPWLIKNYFWTSNPLYPYASSIFHSSLKKPDSGLVALNALQQRLFLYDESLLQVALLPLRIFLDGQDGNPRLFDGVFSPLLIVGLIFGFISIKEKKIRTLTFIVLAVIIFSLLSTGARIRYLAPVYSGLLLLTSLAFTLLSEKFKLGRPLVFSALILQVFLSVSYIAEQGNFTQSYQYLNSNLSRQQYLSDKIPEYPVIEFCNKNLPQNSKLYLIYTGNQFYLYDAETFSSGHTSADHLLSWIKQSHSSAELLNKIRAEHISYLVLNDRRLYEMLQTILDSEQKKIWNEFFKQNMQTQFSYRGFSVYLVQ